MPAVSQAQAKFFRWAEHNPDQAAAERKAPDMTKSQMHDYAVTPNAGLPKKKKTRQYYGEGQ